MEKSYLCSAFPVRWIAGVGVGVWILPILGYWAVLNHEGKCSGRPPELNVQQDRGFRPLAASADSFRPICQGYSDNWLGVCGRLQDRAFRDIFLSEFDGRNLRLQDITLRLVRLRWAVLARSEWERILVEDVQFLDVDLSEGSWESVEIVDSWLSGLRFDRTQMKDSRILQTEIEDTSFRGVHFSNVQFIGVQCSGCDFRDAVFEKSKIDGDFTGALFNEKTILPFSSDEVGVRGFKYRP